ncbi:MAG: lipid-A-disaccharide synthase [Alteromonadaceae bacterium]|nr:lipid-A-disaccharide synthase [Alteromonadaceae bacterium]
MTPKPLRIGIVAGETSGDILASGMVAAIRKQYPDAIFEGIAGPRMQAAGCTTLFDMDELSVMGIVEVLPKIPRILHIRKTVLQYFIENPPDIFIGVDAPDFNLSLEEKLKNLGVLTVHYVCPTIWAWKEKRAKKIARATDAVYCVFPFEPEHCHKHGIKGHFVGHSLADQIPLQVDKAAARETLELSEHDQVIGLLPGSRASEVDMLLEDFVRSAEKLKVKMPELKALIPVVNKQRKAQIEKKLQTLSPKIEVRTIFGHAQEVMIAADCVLLASGTAALEAMMCKSPMVVAYKLKAFTHFMMKRLYKPKYFSLPNILVNREMVPELLQEQVNPDNVADILWQQMQRDKEEFHTECAAVHETLKLQADVVAANTTIQLLKDAGKLPC